MRATFALRGQGRRRAGNAGAYGQVGGAAEDRRHGTGADPGDGTKPGMGGEGPQPIGQSGHGQGEDRRMGRMERWMREPCGARTEAEGWSRADARTWATAAVCMGAGMGGLAVIFLVMLG